MIVVFVFETTDEIKIPSHDDREFGTGNLVGDFPQEFS
jgi:hypothetical protein